MLRSFGAGGVLRRGLCRQRMRGGDSHGGHGEVGHGGHSEKGWFSAGDNDPGGYLFNETPPPPGQSRKWEDWELPYYATGVIAFLMLSIGLTSKPDTNIDTWAHKVALKRLQEEEEEEATAAVSAALPATQNDAT